MAAEPERKKYVDLPYTQFPATLDDESYHARMSDVGADTYQYVKQFNTYYETGNLPACTALLASNPELENCMFDAEKFNWMRDAIIALQRFFLNTVQQYLNDVKVYCKLLENTACAIDDTEVGESNPFTTYSAYKTDRMYKVNYRVSDSFVTKWKAYLQES